MTNDEIRRAVTFAIEALKLETPALDFGEVHERSTAHRLAVHIERKFPPGWNIDCEYDRNNTVRKVVEEIEGCDRQKSTNNILPDIIVHHRRAHGRPHNLLVVEMKKDTARDDGSSNF